MIGIPAVRHSDTGPVKKSPYELLYIDSSPLDRLNRFCLILPEGGGAKLLRSIQELV